MHGGELNISAFVFRDTNRNGVYDTAEHGMMGVAVELHGSGRSVLRRTNGAGYGNFPMSAANRAADVVDAGRYEFVVHIPDGWTATTGNARQPTRFTSMPGAPADMVAERPPEPIGLAPELTIGGRVTAVAATQEEAANPRAVPELRVLGPDGAERAVAIDAGGAFAFAAEAGRWTLRTRGPDGTGTERQLEVTDAPVLLSALAPDRAQDAPRRANALIAFDDLAATEIRKVPSAYKGLQWRNWVAAHRKFYGGEGYINMTMSGEFVAYNGSGHPAVIASERPFDFIGGYFGVAWLEQAEGETLTVQGWRGDALAYQEDIPLSALGPVYFRADFTDVTRLEFSTRRYWQFVADNLAFHIAP